MAKSGADIVSLDWTVTMEEGRRRIGEQMGVQGNLDPAILYGPQDVIKVCALSLSLSLCKCVKGGGCSVYCGGRKSLVAFSQAPVFTCILPSTHPTRFTPTTPETQERTEEILRQGKGFKHVMNLGHGIEATTPEENAKFFIDTVKAYRY
jgi:uroporphyrinogen-III decarboxylase